VFIKIVYVSPLCMRLIDYAFSCLKVKSLYLKSGLYDFLVPFYHRIIRIRRWHEPSLHGVITLLDFCWRYEVQYRLLTVHLCGIFCLSRHLVPVQGPRFLVSCDRPSLYSQICMCPDQIELARTLSSRG
jgi:hypothetical protein